MQIEFFSLVKNPLVLGKVKHVLEDVLRIALIRVLTSCEDYDEISDFIEEPQMELKDMGFLELSNGVPLGDTIRRVVEAVNPDQVRASLLTEPIAEYKSEEKGHGRSETRQWRC